MFNSYNDQNFFAPLDYEESNFDEREDYTDEERGNDQVDNERQDG